MQYTSKKVKDDHRTEVSTNHISDKGLVSGIYQEFLQLHRGKITHLKMSKDGTEEMLAVKSAR